jgi:flagellar biosynthesis protein FlhG
MHDQATHLREIAQRFRKEASSRRPIVLAVTSGKGGVGKSTIALNLAIMLSDAGRNVLLVDADANLGSLDIMLGLAPRFRLGHVLRGEMELQDILLSPQSRLRILPASSGETDYPAMDGDTQERLLDEISELDDRPELVIIDTGAGLNQEIISYAERADEVYVVSSPEPTSVMDAYAMMKVVWGCKPDAEIKLILNCIGSEQEAEEVIGKLRMAVRHFLRRELTVLGTIPADGAVGKAIAQQQPVAKLYPKSDVSRAMRGLAQVILDQTHIVLERRASAQ